MPEKELTATEIEEKKLTFEEILDANNLAEILSEEQSAGVVAQVMERYNTDLQSRAEKQKQLQNIIKLALAVNEEKSFPFQGASNVIYPLIATACIEFGARCYPEIFKDGAIVKAKVIGSDAGQQMKDFDGTDVFEDEEQTKPVMENVGAKMKRGMRIATVMNYQLNEEIPNFEPDMDSLFHALPALGTLFKKIYYDSETKLPCIELIYPDKLIINDFASCLEKAPITHLVEKYPQDVLRSIRSGDYIDFDFDPEVTDSTSSKESDLDNNDPSKKSGDSAEAGLYSFLEQHCWLDLDDDDFLEPYVATVHQASNKLVKLVKRFDELDVIRNKKGELQEIKAQNFFVKYIFLPSPDGSFYGTGLGHLLYNINSAVNSSINQLNDAGTLQNTGGGFLGKNLNIPGGMKNFRLAEWKFVDSFGGNIRDSIVPLPTPDPSQTLFTLLSYLVQAGKELGSLNDILTGENASNIAATTYMGMAEQGMKQFKAVYKRIYASMKQELKKIYLMNSDYLTQRKYSEILDMPLRETPDVKRDFSEGGYDIVPIADVETVNSTQKYARAQFLMGFLQDPFVSPLEVRKEIFEITGIETADKLLITPPPAPNPLLEIEQLKQQTKMAEIQSNSQIEIQKVFAQMEELKAVIAKLEADAVVSHTQSMVNLANAGKIAKDTELAESKEQLDVLDNQIDQQTKQMEIEGRQREAEMKHSLEQQRLQMKVVEMGHEHMQNERDRQHDKEQRAAMSQSKNSEDSSRPAVPSKSNKTE